MVSQAMGLVSRSAQRSCGYIASSALEGETVPLHVVLEAPAFPRDCTELHCPSCTTALTISAITAKLCEFPKPCAP